LIHPPVVLDEKAPARAQQKLELTAALAILRGTAEHEVGQAVSRELAVEREISGHLEGVDDVVAHAHSLAAEAQLVTAADFREHFADGKVAAIEITQVIGADPKAAGHGKRQLRRGVE